MRWPIGGLLGCRWQKCCAATQRGESQRTIARATGQSRNTVEKYPRLAAADGAVEWDQQKAEAGDSEALAALRDAERIFAELRAGGATAVRVEAGRPAERLDRFDPAAEQIVVVHRVVGG